MNKRMLYLLIALICLSLPGIIIVQFFWIRNAIQVREAQFSRSVNDAMGIAVNKLETRESMRLLSKTKISDSLRAILREYTEDSLRRPALPRPRLIRKEDYSFNTDPGANPDHHNRSKVTGIHSRKLKQQRQEKVMDSIMREFKAVTVTVDPLSYEMNFEWNEKQLEKIDSIMKSRERFYRDPGFQYNITEEWSVEPDVPGSGQHSVRYFDLSHPSGRQYIITNPPDPLQTGHEPPMDEIQSYIRN